MFILKKGHQPGVYVPLRALFLVFHFIASISEKWTSLVHFENVSFGIANQ